MLATEHVQLARRFLIDADRELDAGDHFQASEKFWGAASHMVIAEMHRRGIKQSGHKAMVDIVDDIAADHKDRALADVFGVAESLHANFYHGFMEPPDVRRHRRRIHWFVNRMLELTDEQNEAEN